MANVHSNFHDNQLSLQDFDYELTDRHRAVKMYLSLISLAEVIRIML